MEHLSLGWLTLPDVAPADMVTAATAGGFDSVGLRITGRKQAARSKRQREPTTC